MSIIVAVVAVLLAEPSGAIRHRFLTTNVTHTLDTLLAIDRYDKRLRPGFGGAPLVVSVNLAVKSMGPVSENDQSFGLDCYFRQHWYDRRLRYEKLPDLEEFSMSWLFLDKVWKPDTYFINGKKSFLHRITVPNKFLRLRHDGYITYSMRLTITATCPMYLRKFPLDAQRCPLMIGSYGYTNRDLVYEWSPEKPVGLEPGVEIAQFDILNVTTESKKIMVRGGHTYATVQANFWLKRHTGYFMLQVYIPCGIIVTCSWISFWIDPKAVPARVYVPCGLIVLSSWVSFWIDPDDVAARVALGVTTVLSLTTMGFGGRAQLPKVSYWTALDWFVIICFTSVFSVMLEYAVVNFMDKFTKDLKKMIQSRREEDNQKEIVDFLQPSKGSGLRRALSTSCLLEPKTKRLRRRSLVTSVEEETVEESQLRVIKERTRRLSSTVLDYIGSPKSVVKEERMTLPRVIITSDEDLIDLETEPPKVVVDVEEEEEWVDHEGSTSDDEEKKEEEKRNLTDFFQMLRNPRKLWDSIKILPRENDIIDLLDNPDSANKFSRIDILARKNFPILFLISLTIYLYAFSYYLTDDFPEKDPDLLVYKQR